jgi:ferredoxin
LPAKQCDHLPALSQNGFAMNTNLHITIDPVACDAYGYCAELLPEAIVLDEWGYPIVDGRPLPADLVALAKRAVRDCPRRAITLNQKNTAP